MSSANQALPTGLKVGSLLTTFSGLFVFTVSTYMFILFYVSLAHPSEPWRAGQFTPVPYTLDEIEAWDSLVAADFVLAQHIEFANVMNTGALIVVLTWFGLRRRQKWAWYAILAIFLWVGLNDALALIRGHQRPAPLVPEAIGLIGLALARRAVFGESAAVPQPTAQAA